VSSLSRQRAVIVGAALFRAAVADPVVHRAMVEVTQLLQPFSRMQEPDIMRRIEAVSVKAAA
jgi:hypothetical protein